MSMPMHQRIGLRGEQLTARYLRKKRYLIYSAGFATKLGETDIVAYHPKTKTLCFVEVKTRSPGVLLPPSDAVDRQKQNRLLNNAAAFIKIFNKPYEKIRFDIAEVILHDMDHADIHIIENAFGDRAFGDF